ncbi:hypothetical protein ACFYOT_17525 [Saccharothrix saharensis]|uniref:hypothetical protein n=1 Tax=Saccharothrix saharensis TaxID=571190 RepID=UPI0036C98852
MATGAPAQTMLRKAVVRADVDQRIQAIGQEAQAEPESVVGRPTGGQVPADPFASLRGVAGWAVDYVAFLREPIDRLESDQGSVQATADAIRAAAERMRELARGQRETLARPEGWTGTAADAYRASMDRLGEELGSLAEAVAVKGVVVENAGAMVQALREAVLHTVGQYSDSLVPGAIQAYVFAPVTFGASIAVFLGSVVGSATQLGSSVAAKMDDLSAALTRQVDRMKQLDGIADDIGREWERFESVAGGTTAGTMARTASRPLAPERETEALRPMRAVAREHEALQPMQATAREYEPLQPARAVAAENATMQSTRVAAAESEVLRPTGVLAGERLAGRIVAEEPVHHSRADEPVQARHAVRAEPVIQAQPAMRAERMIQAEPAMRAEPMLQAQPVMRAEPMLQAQPAMRAEPVVQAVRVEAPVHEAQPMMRAAEPVTGYRVAEHAVAEPMQARAVSVTHEATVRRVEATE